jgi:hypothetical protein
MALLSMVCLVRLCAVCACRRLQACLNYGLEVLPSLVAVPRGLTLLILLLWGTAAG